MIDPNAAPPPPTRTPPGLDEVLDGMDDGREVYLQARESLEEALNGLKLSPIEERALVHEVESLRDLARKLDEMTVEIAAFGMVSRGKSSVLNALLGRDVFRTGSTHGTTVSKAAERWEGASPAPGPMAGARLILIDTPGIDEVGGEGRDDLARTVARHADVILFVVSGDIQRVELEALERLREAQKPILVVFNQVDRYPDVDRDQIYAKILNERVRNLVRPADVVMTAARPDPVKVRIRHPDGTTTTAWERPEPDVEPLRRRIFEVLKAEGKALVALNTLLAAGDAHASIVAYKLKAREDVADRMIWNFAIAKGAAVALNPIPVADMAGGLAVDVAMIVALSRVYGVPLTHRTASGLVKDMIKALGTLGAVEIATRLLAGGIKASLAGTTVMTGGLALPLTALGYTAIGVAQGGAAATTSYVLGQASKIYLAGGCQWGPMGIKTVIHQILARAKADSVVDRLRDDLKRKVKL